MLSEGTEAPSFALPGYHDGTVEEFALADYVGEDVVVLAFYPMDFSPTCTEELCSLRDIDLLTLMDDVTILGISGDSVHSHRAFAEENALEFPLLSDSLGAVAAEYGVRHEELDGHLQVPMRALFVVDERGRIAYAWRTEDPTVQPDMDALRDAVASVQDDRTAVERYGRGYEHWTYGRSEFENALSAYDREAWTDAAAAFEEAAPYFETAAEAFASADRFAESDVVRETAERARGASEDFEKASRWYATAADHHADGGADLAADYHEDATDRHDAARDVGELPDPDALDVD